MAELGSRQNFGHLGRLLRTQQVVARQIQRYLCGPPPKRRDACICPVGVFAYDGVIYLRRVSPSCPKHGLVTGFRRIH